jgi:hypothetical protein
MFAYNALPIVHSGAETRLMVSADASGIVDFCGILYLYPRKDEALSSFSLDGRAFYFPTGHGLKKSSTAWLRRDKPVAKE